MSTPATLPVELEAKIAGYAQTFTLTDPISLDLLAQMASAQLRLERAAQLEILAQQIEPSLDQLAQLAALERYRRSAEASYHRAFRILCQRQSAACSEETVEFTREPKPSVAIPTVVQPQKPYVRPEPKVGRNEPCPCQSGRKYKVCCLNRKALAA